MNARWWVAAGAAAILALASVSVFAQPGMGPGPWRIGGPVGGQSLSLEQAEAVARRVVAQWAIPGLVPAHLMEFTNNFYVAVKDTATGQGAFEFVIDRFTGYVHPEPQSMMWNTRYGHMRGAGGPGFGGMMGPWYGGPKEPNLTGPLNLDQARAQAQRFLNALFPITKTGEAITFPGYYTIDVTRDGTPVGMLSVNAYTGQVWYHSWHGAFIQEKDLD
jgi:hypothetical protein